MSVRFDVTRALVAACLRAGQLVVVQTRGKRGIVTVRPEPKLSYSVWIKGQDERLACYADHAYGGAGERDAAEHWIALVGEARALRAAQHAATRPAFVTEAELASAAAGGDRADFDERLFYTRMRWSGQRGERWGFIARYYPPGATDGVASRGADCIGPDEDRAGDHWAETCARRGVDVASSIRPAARLARGVR